MTEYNLLLLALKAAKSASNEIINIYNNSSVEIEYKQDNSPLTQADTAAHKAIVEILTATNIPILSEEGKNINYNERNKWTKYWLIDPLDGTKEFINRNGEFTVNIALINNNTPVLGVVFIPVSNTVYFGLKNFGAYKKNNYNNTTSIDELITSSQKIYSGNINNKLTVIASRSHLNNETKNFVENLETKFGNADFVSCGSSLKFCKIAEGIADIYPRFGPTMEWDTAAGHAIAIEADCLVSLEDNKNSLLYNKENLLNPYFIVWKNSFYKIYNNLS